MKLSYFKLFTALDTKRIFSGSRFFIFIIAACSMWLGCKDDDDPVVETEKPVEVIDTDTTSLARLVMSANVFGIFKSDTSINIAEGVDETSMTFLNKAGLPVKLFILSADMKKPKLSLLAMSPYNEYLYGTQKLTEMCRDNQKSGQKIVAAINGDFFTTSSGKPEGYFYKNGVAIVTTRTTASKSFFAYNKDRSIVIGGKDPATGAEVPGITLTNIAQAVSGRQWLVKDFALAAFDDFTVSARTVIGYTADNVIYSIVVDNGDEDYSNGCGLEELRQVMLKLGVARAITLNGGVYSSMVAKSKSEDKWMLQNNPGKTEPLVANGLAFVVNE